MKRIIATLALALALVAGAVAYQTAQAEPADAHDVPFATTVAICQFIRPNPEWSVHAARTDHLWGSHITKCAFVAGSSELCRLLVWETSEVIGFFKVSETSPYCW